MIKHPKDKDLLYEALPVDPDNQILLENEHPLNWVNPIPKKIYDLIVVGAGPAGLIAAMIGARKGKTVALIERDLIGGECFNIGCIPSKSIIRTSRLFADMQNAENFGGTVPPDMPMDFAKLMARMRRIRAQISGHISIEQLQRKGIDVFFGHARFDSKQSITLDSLGLAFKKSIIATGSEPLIPEIPGLAEAGCLTDKTIFNLATRPESLLVIGGGALGCELAQAFSRIGMKVTIVQMDPMFLNNVERDSAQILSSALADDGVAIYLNSTVKKISVNGSKKTIDILTNDVISTITVTDILVSIGQVPNTSDLGLDAANVLLTDEGRVIVNDSLCTSNSHIYAIGNICERQEYVHIPDALARIATNNALLNQHEKIDMTAVPWCIYTDPEIAHIGLQVREAREQNIPIKTFTILMHQVDRAIADSEDVGFVKIHVKEGSDHILGATLIARHAGEIMNIISLAMSSNIGLAKLAAINYPYPTQGDAIKMAASAYLQTLRPTWRDKLRDIFRWQ